MFDDSIGVSCVACDHGCASERRPVIRAGRLGSWPNRRPRAGDTELMAAVREGDVGRVNQLALDRDGLDTTNRQGQTALHLAAALGRPEIAGCLLAHGADHELRDSRGRTPLSLDVTDITVLHSIRQHYQPFPYPKVRVERADDSAVHDAATELEASGILRLPGAIDLPRPETWVWDAPGNSKV